MRAEVIDERTLRSSRLAVAGVFFLNGFGFASWVVRIPAVQEKLALSEGPLGVVLLGGAAGSLNLHRFLGMHLDYYLISIVCRRHHELPTVLFVVPVGLFAVYRHVTGTGAHTHELHVH